MPSPGLPPHASLTSAAGTTFIFSALSSEPWGKVPSSVAYRWAIAGSVAVTAIDWPSPVGYWAVVPAGAWDAWAVILPVITRSLKPAADAVAGRASTAAGRQSTAERRGRRMRATLSPEPEGS